VAVSGVTGAYSMAASDVTETLMHATDGCYSTASRTSNLYAADSVVIQ
jgi:hypothetical protein